MSALRLGMRAAAALGRANVTHAARQAPLALAARRTWFGFGVQREEEIAVRPIPLFERDAPDDYHLYQPELSPEEIAERTEMTKIIHKLADEGKDPDEQVFKRLIDMLIRFDDRVGVMNARELAIEAGVTLPEAEEKKMDEYLADAEARELAS